MRVKRRTFAGIMCEQEVYQVGPRVKDVKNAQPKRARFKTEEERQKHKDNISRKKFIRMILENFNPFGFYSTLTMDDENEVHTFKDAKRLRDNYARRLKRAYPDALFVIVCGRGKNTQRIHFHMMSMGIPRETIIEKWNMGEVSRVVPLREHCYYDEVDHGPDYTALANYLFDHWTPEQGGHRWYATKNMEEPQREDAKEVKTDFRPGKPPEMKGYILVEQKTTPYGYIYFKFIKEPKKEPRKAKRPK